MRRLPLIRCAREPPDRTASGISRSTASATRSPRRTRPRRGHARFRAGRHGDDAERQRPLQAQLGRAPRAPDRSSTFSSTEEQRASDASSSRGAGPAPGSGRRLAEAEARIDDDRSAPMRGAPRSEATPQPRPPREQLALGLPEVVHGHQATQARRPGRRPSRDHRAPQMSFTMAAPEAIAAWRPRPCACPPRSARAAAGQAPAAASPGATPWRRPPDRSRAGGLTADVDEVGTLRHLPSARAPPRRRAGETVAENESGVALTTP